MHKRFLVIGLMMLMACQPENKGGNPSVEVYGKLMEIMQQNKLEARVELSEISTSANTFGLGALAGLSGEIMIIEGKVFTSKAISGKVTVEESDAFGAALLVKTEVDDWSEFNVTSPIKSLKDLERSIEDIASQSGLDLEAIIPFRMQLVTESMDWHIINAAEAESQTHEAYKKAGYSGRLTNKEVEIIGFYSKKHEGIFTHHGSFVHLHFRDYNAQYMGHVDELKTSLTHKIFLPKPIER